MEKKALIVGTGAQACSRRSLSPARNASALTSNTNSTIYRHGIVIGLIERYSQRKGPL